MIEQLAKEEAIKFYDSGKWKTMTAKELVWFQVNQECLAVPWEKFTGAAEKVLGQPIFTHSYANPALIQALKDASRP